VSLPDPPAVPASLPLSAVLDHIVRVILLRVVCPNEVAWAAALWIAATWGVRGPDEPEGPDLFPRLIIRSATKRCGKSLLLEVVLYLSAKPLSAENITTATVFRITEAYRPTWGIDEADRFLRRSEELHGVMNSGYRRDGAVVRMVETVRREGKRAVTSYEPRRFSTFAPMAIAGIGRMLDSIEDRAIRVALKRQPAPRSRSKRIRRRELARLREILDGQLGAYGDAMAQAMASKPDDADFPAWIDDRAADNWEPLIAVAKLAGGPWPGRVQAAMRALCQGPDAEAELSEGERLLADVYEFTREKRLAAAQEFIQWRKSGRPLIVSTGMGKPRPRPLRYDYVSSFDLAVSLMNKDDSPIAAARDANAAKQAVANMLRPFGIRPTQRKHTGTPTRGYDLAPLRVVWRSYRIGG